MKEVDALFSHIERLLNIPREDLEVSHSFWKIQRLEILFLAP